MLNRIIWAAVLMSAVSLGLCALSHVSHFYPILRAAISTPKPNPYAVAARSEEETEVPQKLVQPITVADQDCLRRNVYFEARNQSILGMLAVAMVTIERKNSPNYPASICGVVMAHKQFSWANRDKNRQPKLKNKAERDAWEYAGLVSELSLKLLDIDRPMLTVTHYHATYVSPKWAKKMTSVATIGDHIFYRDKRG